MGSHKMTPFMDIAQRKALLKAARQAPSSTDKPLATEALPPKTPVSSSQRRRTLDGVTVGTGSIAISIPTDVHVTMSSGEILLPDPNALWLLSPAEVAAQYADSRIDVNNPKASIGLSSKKAAELLAANGRNELKPPKQHSEFVKFLLQFTDPLNVLLLVAGVLSGCVAYAVDQSDIVNLYVGVVLWIVVFLSSTYAYIQEGKASNVMASFKNMLPAQAKVVRDGRTQSVPAAELVVGDVLIISTGDIVPADMRVLWTQDCKVETSSLTGESLPLLVCTKSHGTLKLEQARNVCFNSSKCLEGESWGVVVATGDNSLIGQIASLAGGTKQAMTTLQKEIHYFVKYLTIVAIALGATFFGIGMARGQNWSVRADSDLGCWASSREGCS
jgi:magnesium-transporting ATPase (P-type)